MDSVHVWQPAPVVKLSTRAEQKVAFVYLLDSSGSDRCSASFGRAHRLLNQTGFSRVFNKPRKSTDRWLTVLVIPNQLDQPRLGMAVSRKHARLAVQRNRIKRVMRESFRVNKALLAGLDIVVLSRQSAANASKQQLRASIERHWIRVTKP